MHLLIVNADDFGYTPGVNAGIIDAHRYGILSSTTLMANMNAFSQAVALAQANPKLGIGVHLTLTAGRPLLAKLDTLIDKDGNFYNLAHYRQGAVARGDQLYVEWKAQIEKVIASGIKPTHLDSHHHVHRIDAHQQVILRLAQEYQLPVRNNFALPTNVLSTQHYMEDIDAIAGADDLNKAIFRVSLVEQVLQHTSTELGCHPGYIDKDLHQKSSYTLVRALVTSELQDPIYQNLFAQHNIVLGSYRNLS